MTARATEIAVVEEFFAALEDLDVERAVGMLTDDVRYQNVSLPAARGVRSVGRQLRWLAKLGDGFEVRIHSIAASGSTVLTERTDVLIRGRFAAEFWVCGVFEVRDGKIAGWRDYFDWANLLAAGVRGAVRGAVQAAVGRIRRK
ncbi:MAG: limonene-1,2-epoxide hydrolase family protein [Thermocrispum sp.]